MKLIGLRLSFCRIFLALLGILVMPACGGYGGGGSYSSISETMAGPWDFTVTNAKGRVPYVVQANLSQDHHGGISATGSVTTNGPAGNVSTVFTGGSSLSALNAIFLDYPGFTCNGSDTGDRSVTGSINSSSQVTLKWNIGGSEVVTITGTMNHAANPPFTGTFASSGTCGGGSGTIVGKWPTTIIPGTYSGTSSVDSAEAITITLTNTVSSLTGNGTDSKLGNFTLAGNIVGDAFSATMTYASSPANSGPVFGYFDPQLGTIGSILLVSYVGQNTTSCPNNELYFQGTCQIAILALP